MRFPGVVDTLKIGIGTCVDLGNIVLTAVRINRTEQVTPSVGGRWAALLCHDQSSQHLLRSLNVVYHNIDNTFNNNCCNHKLIKQTTV